MITQVLVQYVEFRMDVHRNTPMSIEEFIVQGLKNDTACILHKTCIS